MPLCVHWGPAGESAHPRHSLSSWCWRRRTCCSIGSEIAAAPFPPSKSRLWGVGPDAAVGAVARGLATETPSTTWTATALPLRESPCPAGALPCTNCSISGMVLSKRCVCECLCMTLVGKVGTGCRPLSCHRVREHFGEELMRWALASMIVQVRLPHLSRLLHWGNRNDWSPSAAVHIACVPQGA